MAMVVLFTFGDWMRCIYFPDSGKKPKLFHAFTPQIRWFIGRNMVWQVLRFAACVSHPLAARPDCGKPPGRENYFYMFVSAAVWSMVSASSISWGSESLPSSPTDLRFLVRKYFDIADEHPAWRPLSWCWSRRTAERCFFIPVSMLAPISPMASITSSTGITLLTSANAICAELMAIAAALALRTTQGTSPVRPPGRKQGRAPHLYGNGHGIKYHISITTGNTRWHRRPMAFAVPVSA